MTEISPSSVLSPDVFRQMCFELAIKGYDCLAIASSLGSSPEFVASAIKGYLQQRALMESSPQLVDARLDYLLSKIQPLIELGDLSAINMALKIEAVRSQVMGFNKIPPAQTSTSIVVNGVDMKHLT